MPLDEWVRDVLQQKSLWISDCVAFADQNHWHCVDGACDRKAARREARVLKRRSDRKQARQEERQNRLFWSTELRKLFSQSWEFIRQATDKYPLGQPPQEAFHLQIKRRYGTTFDALKSNDLKNIVETIEHPYPDRILKWLYPNHKEYVKGPYGSFWGVSKKCLRTIKYAQNLHDNQRVKSEPSCSCPNKHHTAGAFKQKNGIFMVYRFCNRCGARSSQMISRNKLSPSELEAACEWERGVVNYTKTDFKPWS